MEVKCPRCGKAALFKPENPHRPFCSERCKLIDLGHWADGSYSIPVQPTAEDIEKLESEIPPNSDDESSSSAPPSHYH